MKKVSIIVPTAKSEKVEYTVQWFDSLHEHWRECIVFHELEQARDALLWRRKVLADKKWRIFKRTIIEEVVE